MESTGNTFENCYISEKGGLFYITEANFTDIGSTYENNAALYGGVYYCKSCNLTLKDATFKNSKAY